MCGYVGAKGVTACIGLGVAGGGILACSTTGIHALSCIYSDDMIHEDPCGPSQAEV